MAPPLWGVQTPSLLQQLQQQVTLTSTSGSAVNARVDLLIQRALAPFVMRHVGTVTECDLIVKGVLAGSARGWVLQNDGTFLSDKAAEAALSEAALRAQATVPGQELTFTCVPPGSGIRMGIDQDRDGTLDADEAPPGGGGPDAVATEDVVVRLIPWEDRVREVLARVMERPAR